jgi:hypothetical protein
MSERDSGRPSTLNRGARINYITEESVYGTVLVSGIIVATGTHGISSFQVFLSVFGTVIVFWAAHVYANTLAGHDAAAAEHANLSSSLWNSIRRSTGFLTSALPPSVVLLLGALKAIDDTVAIWTALWLGVAILALLGYVVYWRRGDSWPIRILGALGTATFGFAMIFLKAIVH